MQNSSIIQTKYGPVQGILEGNTRVFKGIPYAKPPVGDLRFAPTQEPDYHKETLVCDTFGSCAIQEQSILINTTPSEDCLYMNIWAPENASRAPVFFWIHGGGFFNGCGTMNYYDGTPFSQNGIIVVTINYRLGSLGFLALNTLYELYGTTGNWGTLDQLAALRWVRENIAEFGGDPDLITIAGESAGSFSISNLVMSPLAKGMFRRAVMQSGSLFENKEAVPYTRAELRKSIEMSVKFAAEFGADDSPEGLKKLRSADPFTLWKTGYFSSDVTDDCPLAFWPVLDGKVLPENPVSAISNGDYNHADFLIGYNANEGIVFISEHSTEEGARSYVKKVLSAENAEKLFTLCREKNIFVLQIIPEFVTYTFFKSGMTFMKDELSRNGDKVYGYQFDFMADGNYPMAQLGAHHAVDILYVFATFEKAGLRKGTGDEIVEKQMHTLWSNFVKTGNPNSGIALPDTTKWELHEPNSKKTYYIDRQVRCVDAQDADKIRYFYDLQK